MANNNNEHVDIDKAILDELIDKLEREYGQSDDASRNAVILAHGGVPSMKIMARAWADHHQLNILPTIGDLFIAYAVAVDMGVRIGRKLEK